MRTTSRLALAVILLGLPGIAGAQRKVERKLPLAADGGFRIYNLVGTITVHGWAKDTVLVRGSLGRGEQLHMGGSYRGAKIFVESQDDRNPAGSKLEVWLPAGSQLWIKSATAEIDVHDLAGGIDIYSIGGSIHVKGSPRELNAEAIDGTIVIDGSPAWVRAKSASGDVSLTGGSGDASLTTVSGKITIAGGSFERSKVETVSGPIVFTGKLDRGARFDFDTHSGAIDLAIPKSSDLTFNVVTIAGNISNQLSSQRPTSGRFGRGAELQMDLNAGGAQVSVKTFKGTILLRPIQ